MVLQFLHRNANLLFTEERNKIRRNDIREEQEALRSTLFVMQERKRGGRTNYHASADVTELWLLAVMVLKLVRAVVDWSHWFYRKFLFFFHLYFLIIYEINLGDERGTIAD